MNNSRVVIFNRSALQSAAGWIHIVPKGELPNREAGIVQVLDDQSLDSILAGIEKDKNRLGDKWPGVYAGREHFIYNSDQDSAALAWFKDFEKRDDGIWAKADGLTATGTSAIQNRDYKFTSFVADRGDLKKIDGKSEGGLPRYRVMKIETVGFTNQANGKELLTPITNRSLQTATNFPGSDEPADKPQPKTIGQRKMKTVCTLLGLSADASEENVHAAVTKLMNRGDITPDALVTLRAEHKTRGEENQTLLGEQVDGILAEHKITDAKVINRLKPVLTALKNRQERLDTLKDFGFKPGETKATPRVLNRGAGGATAQPVEGEEAALEAEKKRATKVMNRANELQKQTPSLSLATAVTMASKEIE